MSHFLLTYLDNIMVIIFI